LASNCSAKASIVASSHGVHDAISLPCHAHGRSQKPLGGLNNGLPGRLGFGATEATEPPWPPKELIRCGWTRWRGEREAWRAVGGLPAGTGLACADTAPFPPQGRGHQSRIVPAQGVGAATASRFGTSGVPRATRV
jgi:hypothetical protein